MCIISNNGLFKDGLSEPLNLLPWLGLLMPPLSPEGMGLFCVLFKYNRLVLSTAIKTQCCVKSRFFEMVDILMWNIK